MKNRVKKRGLKFLLAAAMTLMMAVESFAASGRIAFSDPTVKVGDDVNVTVKFSTLDGSALGNTDVMLAYDATALEYINETENASGGAGAVRVWSAPMGSSEAVTVLQFKALKAGTTTITVTSYEAYDNNGGTINVEKQGTSTVTINALETSSNDARLQSLQVSPGTLSPYFSPDTKEYAVTVGLDTTDLTVSAVPANDKATVSVEGGTGLSEGENTVICHVTAEDGSTTGDYTITVTKTETAQDEETAEAEPEVLATLDVTAKKIRIIACPSDVEVPSGFKESSIAIGDTRVPGWTWAADESPRYCVFYGMNESGEQNFYRYDLAEKTVQRYFDDSSSTHTDEEYTELAENYNALVDDFNLWRILTAVFAVLALILLIAFLAARKRAAGNLNSNFRGPEGASKKGSRRSAEKSASGRNLTKEERYMRGEEDEFEEEEPEEPEASDDGPVSGREVFVDDSAAYEAEIAGNLAKEEASASRVHGGRDNGKAQDDDDFEFFDL